MAGGSAIRGSRVGAGPMGKQSAVTPHHDSSSRFGAAEAMNRSQVSRLKLRYPKSGTVHVAAYPLDLTKKTLQCLQKLSHTRPT